MTAAATDPTTSPDRSADAFAADVFAGYFALQAVAGTAFWILLATVPVVRRAMELDPHQHAGTSAFLFADLVMGIGGSALAAIGLRRRAAWGSAVALFVAGGMVYATIHIAGWVALTGTGAGLLALMVVPSTLSAWAAWQAWRLAHRTPST